MNDRTTQASTKPRQYSAWLLKRKQSVLAQHFGVAFLNKRYVTLDFDHHILYYAHSPTSRRVSVPIPFSSLLAVTGSAAARRPSVLDPLIKKIGRVETEHPIVIKTEHQLIELYAQSQEDKKQWVSALQLAMEGGRNSIWSRIRSSDYNLVVNPLANPKETLTGVAQTAAVDGSNTTAAVEEEEGEPPAPPTPLPFFDVSLEVATSEAAPAADEMVDIAERAEGAMYGAADLGFEEEEENDSRWSETASSEGKGGRRVSRVDPMVGRSTHERMQHLEFSDTASRSIGEIDDGSDQMISAASSPSAAQLEPPVNAYFEGGPPSCGAETAKEYSLGEGDEEKEGVVHVIVETSFISPVKADDNLKAAAPLDDYNLANLNNAEDDAAEGALENNSNNMNANNVALWMKSLQPSTLSVDVNDMSKDSLDVPILEDLLAPSEHSYEAECWEDKKIARASERTLALGAKVATSIESVEAASETSDSAGESTEETEETEGEVQEKEEKSKGEPDSARLLLALPTIPETPTKGKSLPSSPKIDDDIDAIDTLPMPENCTVQDDKNICLVEEERGNEVGKSGVHSGEEDLVRHDERECVVKNNAIDVEGKGQVEVKLLVGEEVKRTSSVKDEGRLGKEAFHSESKQEETAGVTVSEHWVETVELQSEEEDEASIISANEGRLYKETVLEAEVYVAEEVLACVADPMRIEDADDSFAQYGQGEEESAALCGVLPRPDEQVVRQKKETLVFPTPLKKNGFMEEKRDECQKNGCANDALVSSEEDKKKACVLQTNDTCHAQDAQGDVFLRSFFEHSVHVEDVTHIQKVPAMEESVRVEDVAGDPFRAMEEKIYGHQQEVHDDVFEGAKDKGEEGMDESTHESSTVAMQVTTKNTNPLNDFVVPDSRAQALENVDDDDDDVRACSNQDDPDHDVTSFGPELPKSISGSDGSRALVFCEQVEDLPGEIITLCDAVPRCATSGRHTENLSGAADQDEVKEKKEDTAGATPISKEDAWSANDVTEPKRVSDDDSVPECSRPAVNEKTCMSKYRELMQDEDTHVRHEAEVPKIEDPDHCVASKKNTSADVPRRTEFDDAPRRDVTCIALTDSDTDEDADAFAVNFSPPMPHAHDVSHAAIAEDRGFDFFEAAYPPCDFSQVHHHGTHTDVHVEEFNFAFGTLPAPQAHHHVARPNVHINEVNGVPSSDCNGHAPVQQSFAFPTDRRTAELDILAIGEPSLTAVDAKMITRLSDKEDNEAPPGTDCSTLPPSLPRLLPPPISAVPINYSYDKAALGMCGTNPAAEHAFIPTIDSSTSSDEGSECDLTQRAPVSHYPHIEQLDEDTDERGGLIALR
eukprot:GEMP01001954.1.p1 GENE.GEMP01001954.1~~GEMP01001954.1.p1  ORF type:complete len:1337 (+),score=415.75 GEMP01001954.1:95-4105(+)